VTSADRHYSEDINLTDNLIYLDCSREITQLCAQK
jgi:hypothetical protein